MCSGSLTGTGKLRFYNWKVAGQAGGHRKALGDT